MKKTLFAVLLACATVPALAQQQGAAGPPPSPYAPLQDHPSCTRDELKRLTTAYVEAQGKGSLAALPMDSKAHYLENGKDVDPGAGMWAKPLQVTRAMSFHDDKRCKTFTEVIVTGPTPYVIGTRLYVHNGIIIRVDSLVTKKGDWLFNANSYLKYTTKEDWSPLYKYQLTEPKEMIRGANAVARSACRRVCSTSPIATTWSTRSWASSTCSAGSADGPSRPTVIPSATSTARSARYTR
jgi:hypothetical protein